MLDPIARQCSQAYWPRPGNHSADRAAGDAFVDSLTIGQLAEFFSTCTTGPTFCMVRRRVTQLLEKLPPNIVDKREAALHALEQARLAMHALNDVANAALGTELV